MKSESKVSWNVCGWKPKCKVHFETWHKKEPEVEEEVAVKEEVESEKSEPEKLSPSSSKSSVGDQPSGDVEEEATGVQEEPTKVASPALRAVLPQAKVTFNFQLFPMKS